MVDDFDRFLSEALVPPERESDRRFVGRVQVLILLDQRLRAERRALFARLASEVIALAAVASGLMWLGRAPDVVRFAAESPAFALAGLLAGFALLIGVFSSRSSEAEQA